jgi:hypothetical protein
MDERVTTQMSHPEPAALEDETGRLPWHPPAGPLLSGRQFRGGSTRPVADGSSGPIPYAPTRDLPFAFREDQDGNAYSRPVGGGVNDRDGGLAPGGMRASAREVFGVFGDGPTGPVNDGYSFGHGRNVACIPVHRQGLDATFARAFEGGD